MLQFQLGGEQFVVHLSHAQHGGDSLKVILATELDAYLSRRRLNL